MNVCVQCGLEEKKDFGGYPLKKFKGKPFPNFA